MFSPGDIRRPMVAVAFLVVGLAACSGTPAGSNSSPAATGVTPTQGVASPAPATRPPSPTAASIKDMDICALISAEQIESTVGFAVGDGERMEFQSETAGCQWDAADSSGIQFVSIALYAFREGAWNPPDPGEPDGELVTGVGDEAYRKEIGLSDTAGDLVVHSGGLLINVSLFNDSRPYEELHPQQEKLATLLISRL